MSHDVTPFKGRSGTVVKPTRLLKQFTKSGHVAEIRERTVAAFKAMEFVVFVNGSLLESQMFHGHRLDEYASAVSKRAEQFTEDDWLEQPATAKGP